MLRKMKNTPAKDFIKYSLEFIEEQNVFLQKNKSNKEQLWKESPNQLNRISSKEFLRFSCPTRFLREAAEKSVNCRTSFWTEADMEFWKEGLSLIM
ncbi:hypothetical protein TNCV_5063311 [Trichonephila clavipes]|nr:hypothetical protein TNCV_5063311 [Trichonephila clavipes]